MGSPYTLAPPERRKRSMPAQLRYHDHGSEVEDDDQVRTYKRPAKKRRMEKSGNLSFGEQVSLMTPADPSDNDDDDSDHDEDDDAHHEEDGRTIRRQHSRHGPNYDNKIHHNNPGADTKAKAPKKKKNDAPEEETTKFPISRGRKFKQAIRKQSQQSQNWDPRFNPAVAKASAPRGTYDFLDEKRNDEIAVLERAAAKASRVAEHSASATAAKQKVQLQAEIRKMKNQKADREKKKKEKEALAEARKKEKGAVGQGKMPFFMKRGDKRKMLDEDRVKGMSEKELERAAERRAKKVAERERRSLPRERRFVR